MIRCCTTAGASSAAQDQYERAKQNVMQAALFASRLTCEERKKLASELLSAESVVLLLQCLEGNRK